MPYARFDLFMLASVSVLQARRMWGSNKAPRHRVNGPGHGTERSFSMRVQDTLAPQAGAPPIGPGF